MIITTKAETNEENLPNRTHFSPLETQNHVSALYNYGVLMFEMKRETEKLRELLKNQIRGTLIYDLYFFSCLHSYFFHYKKIIYL